MKKFGVAGVIALAIVLSVSVAYAIGPCWGGFGGWASGPSQGYATLTPEQKANVDKFWNEVLPLRQQMLAKRSEMLGLMAAPAPDWNAIQQKRSEMVGLRTQIQKKAYEAGLPAIGGWGCGRGMCGIGGGPVGMGMMRGWMY
jgi:Spy/CpxP family protein refolding chaperone